MTAVTLRKTLNKFNRSDLDSAVKKWPFFLDNDDLQISWDGNQSKSELIGQITRKSIKKRVSSHDVAELDLLYIQKHSFMKKWGIFKLTKVQGNQKEKNVVIPEELCGLLDQALNNFFDVVVSLSSLKDVFWLRFHFDSESELYRPGDIVYMVYYPHTDYVALTTMRQAHKEGISQALMVAIGCTEVTEMKLTGKSVTSLLQLALNKDSQGSFSQFRLNQIDGNPLSVRKKQKRKVPEEEDSDVLTSENITQKRRRTEALLEIFGPNEQPQLEKVEFRLDTKFRGFKYAPGMRERTEPFRCRVKFEGPSVLEGIRKMAEIGIMDIKMPSHLRNLHSLGKNQMTLAEKTVEKTPTKT